MNKYTKAVLILIAVSFLTTSVKAGEATNAELNKLHALDLETEDLNFTFSLVQFGISGDKTPANSVYIRGIYATEEQCHSDLLDVEYFSTFKKDITGELFGIQESMHGISMVVCTLNVGIVIKK